MKKFKPKQDQKYWYLEGQINWVDLRVGRDTWDCEFETCYSNVFRTKKEAKIALEKIKKILK